LANQVSDLGISFLTLWEEKMFLGQEFLTWLWLNSLVDSHFSVKDGQSNFELWFINFIKFENGIEDSKRFVTCQSSGENIGQQWAEAIAAVIDNKMIVNCRLLISNQDKRWELTLSADTIAPKSVKFETAINFNEGGDEQLNLEGTLLDRLAMLMELNSIIENLLDFFLTLRLSKDWQDKELPRLRKWLLKWEQQVREQASA
jgi:recombination associated protein RdgC